MESSIVGFLKQNQYKIIFRRNTYIGIIGCVPSWLYYTNLFVNETKDEIKSNAWFNAGGDGTNWRTKLNDPMFGPKIGYGGGLKGPLKRSASILRRNRAQILRLMT